eukprot:9766337-Ditylum_brightwellii.AAC.1
MNNTSDANNAKHQRNATKSVVFDTDTSSNANNNNNSESSRITMWSRGINGSTAGSRSATNSQQQDTTSKNKKSIFFTPQ